MCLHLSRDTLKRFLMEQAKTEDVESAKDSILGKWAMVAKKAKSLFNEMTSRLFPHLIKMCLLDQMSTSTNATNDEVRNTLGLVTLFTTILRSNQNSTALNHAVFLRLLIQDRYVVSLLEFYGRQKITDSQVKQVFHENLDEFKHCLNSFSLDSTDLLSSKAADQLYYKRITLFNQICYKHISADFTAISLQLVGSVGLPENLREVLTQLDIEDLTMFFTALHLPLPKAPKSIDEKTFRIEILVKEFS